MVQNRAESDSIAHIQSSGNAFFLFQGGKSQTIMGKAGSGAFAVDWRTSADDRLFPAVASGTPPF